MRHIYGLEKRENTCVAFGNFECMHKGHFAVINKTVEVAKEKGLSPIMVSLYNKGEKVYTTEEEKAYLVDKTGVEELFSTIEDQIFELKDFVKHVIKNTLGAKAIVTSKGINYRGEGFDKLVEACTEYGVEICLVDEVLDNGKAIDKAMFKDAFDANNFEKITELCGHPFIILGPVEHGKALGRTVGMPTANLGAGCNKILPNDSAYATISKIGKETYMGFTNIGRRPSVDNDDRITIETLILDFASNIYGYRKVLEVHFLIRGVKKFNSLQEVQEQVELDKIASREKLQRLI